ncbi:MULTISPECIES: hypothetical protein [Streptomyces]|uniref:hypothetical protein n=1 Tax=Streptomyces TaxID=1883 RepID=UPI00324C6974
MIHSPTLVAEIRELPPEDGWARCEGTGRACFVCCCGLTTGFIDRAEAIRVAKEHPDALQSAQADDASQNRHNAPDEPPALPR